jgi:hypothetical protein
MLKHIISLFLVLFILFHSFLDAQLYAPEADHSEEVSYDTPVSIDSIYIFNVPVYGGSTDCKLEAISPDSLDGWQFSWSVYDTASVNFIDFMTVKGVSSSVVDTIGSPGGYQVIINKGTVTDTFRAWIFINDYNVEITSKNTSGIVPAYYYSCDFIDLEAEVDESVYSYYFPGRSDTILYVANNYDDIDWEYENEEGSGLKPGSRLDPRIGSPPYEDTEYTITVTDRFGLERSDNVLYESIQSKAGFENMYISLSDDKYYPEEYGLLYGGSYNNISAPAKFKFYDNDSKNSVTYNIKFGNGEDTTFYNTEDTIIYEYLYPGEYYVTYITRSAEPYECIDSVNAIITVDAPVIEGFAGGNETEELPLMPNVFTPNWDGYDDVLHLYDEGNFPEGIANDLFRPVDVSIYTIDIVIFNRYGRKVHEYYGNIRNWKGWDGKILDSGRDASEGVYFYIIKRVNAIEDWEELKLKEYSQKVKRGFIHLYRKPR